MELQSVSANSIAGFLLGRRTSMLACLGVVLCFAGSANAQSGRKVDPQKKPQDKPDVRIETREVRLPVRAYDSHGKPVNDLTPKDFVILENGEPRQTTSIRLEPANVLLILDLSNEIGTFKNGESERNAIFSDDLDYRQETGGDMVRRKSSPLIEQPAIKDFAVKLIRELAPTDRMAIIQYSDKVQLMQDWTSDKQQALDSLSSKLRFGIQSHYYDALFLASQKMAECATGRRVIVLVSDGLDSASKATQKRATDAILKADTALFVVSFTDLLRTEIGRAVKYSVAHEANNVPNYKRQKELERFVRGLDLPEAELKRLAELTGGEFYLPARFRFFFEQPDIIVKDLGAQYTLTYNTEREFSDIDYHNIQVFGARGGITVKARQRRYSD